MVSLLIACVIIAGPPLVLGAAMSRMDRRAERRRKRMFAAGRIEPRTVVPVYRIRHVFAGGPCEYQTTHMDSGRPVREAA